MQATQYIRKRNAGFTSRSRKWIISIVALLLIGSLINVVVLWTIGTLAPINVLRYDYLADPQTIWQSVPRQIEAPSVCKATRCSSFGHTLVSWWLYGELEHTPDNRIVVPEAEYIIEYSIGWPLRCVTEQTAGYSDRPVSYPKGRLSIPGPWLPRRVSFAGDGLVPLNIMPLPFAANAVFYGALVLLVRQRMYDVRPYYRRVKGRCPRCGYDLRSDRSAGCPECGRGRASTPVTLKGATRT